MISHFNHIIKFALLLAILTFCYLLPSSLHAQTSDIETSLTTSKTEFTIGEPITLTLAITYPVNLTILLPELDRWGGLRVRSQSRLTHQDNEDGSKTSQQTIIASRFLPGDFATPLLTVTVRTSEGRIFEQYASPISLTIISVLTEENPELLDIRPQAKLSEPWYSSFGSDSIIWPLLALAVVTALAYWWIFRTGDRKPMEFIDSRLPYQIALDELDDIERLNLPVQGQFKQYYILLSGCLRTYLENRYDVPAMDSTNTEIKIDLQAIAIIQASRVKQLMSMLDECDLGKFAEFTPTIEDTDRLHGQAKQWIVEEETRSVQ